MHKLELEVDGTKEAASKHHQQETMMHISITPTEQNCLLCSKIHFIRCLYKNLGAQYKNNACNPNARLPTR